MKRSDDEIGASGSQEITRPELSFATRSYCIDVKETFRDQIHKYLTFLELMKNYNEKRIGNGAMLERLEVLFKGHENLILGIKTCFPKELQIALDEEEAPPKKTVEFEEVLGFVNRIKRRFKHDDHAFQFFLDIMFMDPEDKMNITDVYNESSTLLKDHSDLLEEFTRLFPATSAPYSEAQLHREQRKRLDKDNLERRSRDLDGREAEQNNLKRKLSIRTEGFERQRSRARYSGPAPHSVPSGSGHRQINQYEQNMNKCEDERFEYDMLLENLKSAAKSAEEIIQKNIKFEGSFPIQEHFTASNLRCIEQLYGDHGLEVMDTIRKNPAVSLPLILKRLKQKQDEWKKCGEKFKAVWADVYKKNHNKSLDHR